MHPQPAVVETRPPVWTARTPSTERSVTPSAASASRPACAVHGEDRHGVRGLVDPALDQRPCAALHSPIHALDGRRRNPYDRRACPSCTRSSSSPRPARRSSRCPARRSSTSSRARSPRAARAGIVSALGIQAGGLVHVIGGDDRGVGAAGLLGRRVQRRQVRGRGVPDLPRRSAGCSTARSRRSEGGAAAPGASGCSGRA